MKEKKQTSKSHGYSDKQAVEKPARHSSFHDEDHLRYIKTLFFQRPVVQNRKTSFKPRRDQPEDYFCLSASLPNTLRLCLQYQGEFLQVGQQAVINDENLKAIGTIVELLS